MGSILKCELFWFNQHRSDEAGKPYLSTHKLRWFTDKRFRQAVHYATNRQGIINAPLGKGEPLTSIIAPAQGKWHNPDLPRYDYDPLKARDLLIESGFYWDEQGKLFDHEGNPVEFTLLVSVFRHYW